MLYANQDYRGAAADFDLTVAIAPKYHQAYLLRAITAQVQGNLPGAQAAYTKMIAADPQNTLAYQNRAGVWGNKSIDLLHESIFSKSFQQLESPNLLFMQEV